MPRLHRVVRVGAVVLLAVAAVASSLVEARSLAQLSKLTAARQQHVASTSGLADLSLPSCPWGTECARCQYVCLQFSNNVPDCLKECPTSHSVAASRLVGHDSGNACYDRCFAKEDQCINSAGAACLNLVDCSRKVQTRCYAKTQECKFQCDKATVKASELISKVGLASTRVGTACTSSCWYESQDRYDQIVKSGRCGDNSRYTDVEEKCFAQVKDETMAWASKCAKCCDPLQKLNPFSDC